MGAAQRGFVIMALAFPVYLLWKGRLTAYLALMTATPATGTAGTTSLPQPIGGGSLTLPTVGGIIVPPIQTQYAPGTM